MRKITVFIALAVLLILCAIPVYAADIPPLPHAFYGDLTINNSPAPTGTEVEARGEGVRVGIEGNPIETGEVGKYGSADPLGPKLIVQGDIADGATLTFYVNGVSSGKTAKWRSGEVTKLNLAATITVAPPTAPPGVAAPAAFSISSLSISPSEVYVGETVTISASVANTGGESGSYKVTLKINGVVEATKEVTVAAGKSKSVSFTTSKDVAGTYSVDVNGLTGSFIVKEKVVPPAPAAFSVSSLKISPSEVYVGEAVTISISVANTGGQSGSYKVTLKMNGVVEATMEVTVAAGKSESVSFTTSRDKPGSYTVDVNGLTGSFIVKEKVVPLAPAAFTVSSLNISPEEVFVGETVTISASVANTGGESGSYKVTLKINGVVEATKEVTLAAGKSVSVSFTTSKDVAGTYSVDVNGLTGSFTVKTPVTPPAPKPINWPLLIGGIIGGAIVVAVLIFFLVRRRAE